MTTPLYHDSLIAAITKYHNINEKHKTLAQEVKEIKNGIREWLKINDKQEYEVVVEDTIYRMSLTPTVSRSVDYTILEEMLTPDQYNEIVSEKETERLNVGPVRETKQPRKKKTKAPKAS